MTIKKCQKIILYNINPGIILVMSPARNLLKVRVRNIQFTIDHRF